MIREFWPRDLSEIEQIHSKFYQNEFPLPNFSKFLMAFSVLHDDKIVLSGGVRPILEAIAITDKDTSVRVRCAALYELLQASMFTAGRCGYDQIHTTVINNDKWSNQLIKAGFKPVNGQVLVIEV